MFMFAGTVCFALQHRIKAHARIIWGVSWSWDSLFFATASRDGTVKVWSPKGLSSNSMPIASVKLSQPVTAIAFSPQDSTATANTKPDATPSQHKLALGSEKGAVTVWNVVHSSDTVSVICVWESPVAISHCAPVRRICWQHQSGEFSERYSNHTPTRLATCADDHCIRIFKVNDS